MPKSKNRKGHKQKVNHFKKEIQVIRKRTQDEMMQEYIKAMQLKQDSMKKQATGEDVENTDINVDLDVDIPAVDDNIQEAVVVDTEVKPEEIKATEK